MKQKKYFILTFVFMLLILIVAALCYLSWGSFKISPEEMLKTVLGKGTKMQNVAIFKIRLPRMLVGVCVAIALSTAGSILQTVTQNDLVDSGIIGINAGAAVAAVLFISFQTANYYSELGVLSIYVLPAMAIIGAGMAALLLYVLSSRKKIRPKRLLLVGIGLSAGLNAFLTFFFFRAQTGEYNRILTWTSGSLWGSGWNYAKIIMPITFIMFLVILWNHQKLDVLLLSEEYATSLGLNVSKERRKFLIYSVIMAGSATAFAGNVAFIGLIAPHIARKLVGTYHRYYLITAGMVSAIIVLFADALSRNLFSPIEIPVGVTISILGVPYFIYLIIKEN